MQLANLIKSRKEIIPERKGFIQERKELIKDLFENVEEYTKTNIELVKLKATAKVSNVVSSLLAQIAVVALAFFFITMINIGIAFWIGDAMGRTHLGFFVVAGFYALSAIVVYMFRVSLIKTPISNTIIKQALKDKSHVESQSN